MDNEYETMFKLLMNERNELRKYIVDICELLGIDTGQSILGANCLEFYAVLCSTAENKIKDLQEQLKRKEQECKELKKKQRSLEVSKELYDSYCETYCRANDIAINLHKEFSFIEQQQIIPSIQEGIRILRFKRDKYKQALDEIRQYRVCEINDVDGEEDDVILGIIDEVMGP